jgi:hypothetical protein
VTHIVSEPEMDGMEHQVGHKYVYHYDEEATGVEDEGDDEEYIDEIYDIVDAVVSRTDDPSLPVFTFRSFVLGTFFAILLSVVNTLFTFRTNQVRKRGCLLIKNDDVHGIMHKAALFDGYLISGCS